MATAPRQKRRSKEDFGSKQPRHGVYGTSETGFLLVPNRAMWAVHRAAHRCRAWRRSPPLTVEALGALAKIPKPTVQNWLDKYRDYPWVEAWLRGQRPSTQLARIATPQMVERCRRAWDYVAHCRDAGLHDLAYRRWFRLGQIPSLEWLKWLYGFDAPPGVFVVPEGIWRLREEGRPGRIGAEAGVPKKMRLRWGKDPQRRELLALAKDGAAANGDYKALHAHEGWNQLGEGERTRMVAYAEAATQSACWKRAGITSVDYYEARRGAEQLGAREDFERYANGEEASTEGKSFLRSGLVAKNFFVPTAGMFGFRRAARREMAKRGVRLLSDLPGFDGWLWDWTRPLSGSGRYDLPASVSGPPEIQARTEPAQSTVEVAAATSPVADQASETTQLTKVEHAMLVYTRDPNQPIRAVARQVGCSPSLLSRDERFRRLREAHQGRLPRGSKSKAGDLEAAADADDP